MLSSFREWLCPLSIHLTPFIHLDPLSSSLNVAFSFSRLFLLYLAASDSCLHFALFLSSSLLNSISGHVFALLAIFRRVKGLMSRDVYVSVVRK
jgi:hypothetical protein